MNKLLVSFSCVLVLSFAGSNRSEAKIPVFSASCPGPVAVEGTPKGKVRIDGKPARLKVFNSNYFEASIPGFTVSVAKDGGGLIVSYTARGGANGICRVR